MKRIILRGIAVLSLMPLTTYAQKTASAIEFYAIAGPKFNSFDSRFSPNISSDISSFALGAGSSWHCHRLLIGTEFYYSSGNKSEQLETLQYNGFNSHFFVGYNLLKHRSWRLEPTLGFNLGNNQLIAQDEHNTRFLNLKNNQGGITTAISFTNVSRQGLTWGLKGGYTFALGDSDWKYKASGVKTEWKDNTSAFFIAITAGGLLSLGRR